MSRKRAFEVFFAVGDPSRRSSLWRTWGTAKGDVFLVNSEVNSDFKLSLHPPTDRHQRSRCHLSYVDEESFNAAKSGEHPLVLVEDLPQGVRKGEGRRVRAIR
jgi:hypothetical protein